MSKYRIAALIPIAMLSLMAAPSHAHALTRVFLTSGSSWTVPGDWNSASNTIEAIGGGGGDDPYWDMAGGGGAYAKISNLTLTPSASVSYQIGIGGDYNGAGSAGGDSWFSSPSTLLAEGGSDPSAYPNGGRASASVGSVKYSGGNGLCGFAGCGGGGAAGPSGNGKDGGWFNDSPDYGIAGGGGGGANGGSSTAGSNTITANGGAGGAGNSGTGGGAGGTSSTPGVSGTNGGGGGGGSVTRAAGNGGSDTAFDSTHGAGGGGGAAGTSSSAPGPGHGGLYGGGGGRSAGTFLGDGVGAQGIIVITYAPLELPTCTISANSSSIVPGGQVNLSWTTTNATSASINQGIGTVSTGSGSTSATVTSSVTYTLSVSNTGGSGSCNVSVSAASSQFLLQRGAINIRGGSTVIR